MLVWDDCHNSWNKWDVKYIRTKHNTETKRNMYIGLVSSQRDEMSHCDILPLKSIKKGRSGRTYNPSTLRPNVRVGVVKQVTLRGVDVLLALKYHLNI
jgi:hypothetical protein